MREELAELDEYLRLARNIREWTASTSMSGKATFILAGLLGMNVVV